MTDVDWDDLDRLKVERPALVLELLTSGDGRCFVRAVEAGFDVDPSFGATPLGWAEFFHKDEAAEYLRAVASDRQG